MKQKKYRIFGAMLLADVILPVAFGGHTFTYGVGEGLGGGAVVRAGVRVRITLRGRADVGIVLRVYDGSGEQFKRLEYLKEVMDEEPIFTEKQLGLMVWIADYYLCTLGQVSRQALPVGIRGGEWKVPTLQALELVPQYRASEEMPEEVRGKVAAERAWDGFFKVANNFVATKKLLTREKVSLAGLKKLEVLGVLQAVEVAARSYCRVGGGYRVGLHDEVVTTILEEAKPVFLEQRGVGPDMEQIVEELIGRQAVDGRMTLVVVPDNYSCGVWQERLGALETVVSNTARTSVSRAETYMRVLHYSDTLDAVIGTRQALTLPYTRLGMVVVVEEDDYGHKSDRAPRLNARDTAIMLAAQHHAKIVLTSRSPSLEAYANCRFDRWEHIVVGSQGVTSKVKVLEKGRKILFSKYLLARMEQTLEAGEQVVILQNRRGFASYVECSDCGHVPMCARCSVMLTLHRDDSTLRCHYCGFTQPATNACPACASPNIRPVGMGTERVAEALTEHFPAVRVARVDADTISRTGAFGETSQDTADAQADIIVGTQLILRGMRLDRATLAAVVNADNMFVSADFRTSERALNALMRLRNLLPPSGELIIQTSDIKNPVLKALEWGETDKFYARELDERTAMSYPPAVRMVVIKVSHHYKDRAGFAALGLANELHKLLGTRVSAPYDPMIDKISDRFIFEIQVRLERTARLGEMKAALLGVVERYKKRYITASAGTAGVEVSVDVDPIS